MVVLESGKDRELFRKSIGVCFFFFGFFFSKIYDKSGMHKVYWDALILAPRGGTLLGHH